MTERSQIKTNELLHTSNLWLERIQRNLSKMGPASVFHRGFDFISFLKMLSLSAPGGSAADFNELKRELAKLVVLSSPGSWAE